METWGEARYTCLQRSQVKVYCPPSIQADSDLVEAEDKCILDTYEPTPPQDPGPDPGGIQHVPIICLKPALEGLETLHPYRLQNSLVNL